MNHCPRARGSTYHNLEESIESQCLRDFVQPHLRAGTKEKCAAVLGEKLRGLSSGLVPDRGNDRDWYTENNMQSKMQCCLVLKRPTHGVENDPLGEVQIGRGKQAPGLLQECYDEVETGLDFLIKRNAFAQIRNTFSQM